MVRSRIFRFTLAIFSMAALAFGQYTNATVSGSVYDPGGAVVAGANVTLHSAATGYSKVLQTGSDGTFLFPATPVGQYEITVQKPGFSKYVQSGITVAVNQAANVPVTLRVGDLNQQITVSGDAELVTTQTASVAQVITTKSIVDLPLNGRQPQALLFLAAGALDETGKYCLVNCQGGVIRASRMPTLAAGGPAR